MEAVHFGTKEIFDAIFTILLCIIAFYVKQSNTDVRESLKEFRASIQELFIKVAVHETKINGIDSKVENHIVKYRK